jgi:hypothetical protein
MSQSRVVAIAGALLLSATAIAQQARCDPPASPLTWQKVTQGTDPAKAFVPPPNILGDSAAPTSVELVEMQDQHPWGEAPRRVVWLARYA